MITYTCDKCGKKVQRGIDYPEMDNALVRFDNDSFVRNLDDVDSIDLCRDCYNDLVAWLKSPWSFQGLLRDAQDDDWSDAT